ncbi:jg5787 [Pararge aegeria aegeria]|uniref:Jg5787 protein n=1 Tax=Pararge aegeria aegeria TaxID=348720 RepID=A0A8S4R2Q2_9NEOP|nr:jg5787 [Pararge aegeria aegeria]
MTKPLHNKEISGTQKDQISTNNITQENMSLKLTSSCSCPQCNSIECFKIRNENANLLCTCNNCKNTFSAKNVLRKKSGDGCGREVITTLNEYSTKNSPYFDTVNIKYDKKGKHEENKTVYKNYEQTKDTLDTKSCLSSYKVDHERFAKESRSANSKSNTKDHRCFEITKLVVIKDEQKHTLHTKTDLDSKIIDDHGCHKGTKETVKDIEKNEDEKHAHELTDQLNTNLNKDSKEKKFDKNCFQATKNDHKNQSQKHTLNKHIKNDLSVIELVEKSCCEKVMTRHRKVLHDEDNTLNTFSKTDLSHEKLNEKNYREISNKIIEEYEQKDTLDKQIKSKNSEVNLRKCTKLSYKDTTFIKDKIRKNERSYEKSYTRNYSVAMNFARNKEKTESENPAATLSAQIMNLPCQVFKDSLSSHKTARPVNTNKIITKQDILKKLKEVYKACSCKVCECIAGFSANDVFTDYTCGCEYTEQTHNLRRDSNQTLHECDQLAPSGCPCYRCDRKDCRGIWKNKMEITGCDCKPCDCVKISKSFTRKCDCEPCQCEECTPLNFRVPRSVIVAPVQGNFQQNLCQCAPCECVQCTQNYGAMVSSLMREVSTGMVSQTNCNCESCASNSCQFDGVNCRCNTQNRIMIKPIDRSVRDFDLRSTLIAENSFNQKPSSKFKNCDTIAMFAFSKKYSNTLFNKFGDDCHCMHCECIICKEKEITGNPSKDSYKDFLLGLSNISDQTFNACKCKHCKCQACCKNEEFVSDTIKAYRAVNNCSCDICDCLTCKGLKYSSLDNDIKHFSKLSFKNQPPESLTSNCNDTKDFVYPLRKGKLLTPTMFEAKILSYPQLQSVIHIKKKSMPNTLISQVTENKFDNKLVCSQNLTISHSKSVNKYFGSDNNYNQSSYTTLLSTYEYYLNDSNINTVSKDIGNKLNNESLLTSYILPSTNHLQHSMHKVINRKQSHIEAKTDQIKNVIDYQSSKVKIKNDEDLFCNRIISFEKSISQLQKDISQNLKTLAAIRSIIQLSHENFCESNVDFVFSDIMPEKSCSYVDKPSMINPVIRIFEEPDKTEQSIRKIVNYKESMVVGTAKNYNNIKNNKNDNFSKGDNKMYSQRMKKSKRNSSKLRKYLARSKVKKLSLHSENKISDFISDHLKENYRQHAKRKILNLNFSCTKSASTSYENCVVPEPDRSSAEIHSEKQRSQTDIHQGDNRLWSIQNKNLYINKAALTHTDICTIPELELNIKREVQSVSLQTNETRGYAALTNFYAEVSKLLKSPLLQLDCIKKYFKMYDIHIKDYDNIHLGFKNKLDLPSNHACRTATSRTHKQKLLVDKGINCNIGQCKEVVNEEYMKKLMDFLLTRTVYKSELTKTFNNQPENVSSSPKIPNPVKCSCEGLKASFLDLRRVSDHTVLVRWRTPSELEHVQGYELQVDGRAVQKILSPKRCMAILTCLPNCEKLLLTIRTLTITVLPSGHYPAATVVYCPREKRSIGHPH